MCESDFDPVEGGISDGRVDCLLETTLDPVLDAAGTSRNPEKALLKVTVCDPACGDGRILAAAAGRIAKRVAAAREHTPEPSADAVRRALRDVTENCLYGVDLSDAAVERTKERLRHDCGAPGAALDDRIRPGNSLIGTVPALIDAGIPDSAFKPADGDDPKFARSLRRANVKPAPGQRTLFSDTRPGQAGRLKRLVADAWCAAFVWVKRPDSPPAIVDRSFRDLRERGPAGVLPETLKEIERLRDEYRFFHWHLEFPDVFRRGGFSCVVTDPPRDTVDRHEDRAAFSFARGSGAYPDCAEGLGEPGVTALRADHLFAERLATIVAPRGRAGCVVPAALATGPGGRHLFGSLTRRGRLASLYGFEDQSSLLTLTGDESPAGAARYAFALRDPGELREDPGRAYTLTADEIALINPNTGSPPAFSGRREAALVTELYGRVPVLQDETRADGNPWKLRLAPPFFRLRSDSALFRAPEEPEDGDEDAPGPGLLPVYEATMIKAFDHQHGPPRYWLADPSPVAERLEELGWRWGWLCGWCRTARDEDERAVVAAFLPRTAVTESFPLMMPRSVPPFVAGLVAAQSSLVFDFVARQKLGAHPKIRPEAWKQLPVPTPRMLEPHLPFLVPRVLELVYTDEDLAPLARDLDDDGNPFAWDDDRRAELRAELDAFFFRLYGIEDRVEAAFIVESFPGEPGALVLDAYDRMASADADGSPYETRIIPPPGRGPRAARD
ncbi:MAG: hypothetical protein FWE35_23465 [Streptosporangiales bacterium]|nr:hypothetical protein [Streptosporangiales bacterium]